METAVTSVSPSSGTTSAAAAAAAAAQPAVADHASPRPEESSMPVLAADRVGTLILLLATSSASGSACPDRTPPRWRPAIPRCRSSTPWPASSTGLAEVGAGDRAEAGRSLPPPVVGLRHPATPRRGSGPAPRPGPSSPTGPAGPAGRARLRHARRIRGARTSRADVPLATARAGHRLGPAGPLARRRGTHGPDPGAGARGGRDDRLDPGRAASASPP